MRVYSSLSLRTKQTEPRKGGVSFPQTSKERKTTLFFIVVFACCFLHQYHSFSDGKISRNTYHPVTRRLKYLLVLRVFFVLRRERSPLSKSFQIKLSPQSLQDERTNTHYNTQIKNTICPARGLQSPWAART
jgi:hypothetical protein